MRPAGEVRQALHDAALELLTPERAPTMMEMASRAQVGFLAARRTVDNMRRAGHLVIVRNRRVEYRNRPVAEYAPAGVQGAPSGAMCPLRAALQGWVTEEAVAA